MARVAVAPILPENLEAVGEFLHRHLNSRITAAEWSAAARPSWLTNAPNHGFMLMGEKEILGVYLAFYSTRLISDRHERFCNLAAWCVLPGYRAYSLLLLKSLLGQSGFHFTDFSPSGNAIHVNERLKFTHLDTKTALVPNVPRFTWPSQCRVIVDHDDIRKLLSGTDLEIYEHHRHARAATHVVLRGEGRCCYVIYRRDRRKGLPLFASVLYVSDQQAFRKMAREFGSYLLLRQGVPMTLVELRVAGGRPMGSILLSSSRPKMYRSETLTPNQIDYLYSELTCVAW